MWSLTVVLGSHNYSLHAQGTVLSPGWGAISLKCIPENSGLIPEWERQGSSLIWVHWHQNVDIPDRWSAVISIAYFLRKNNLGVRFRNDCSWDNWWHVEKANPGRKQQSIFPSVQSREFHFSSPSYVHSYIYFKDLFETIHSVHLWIWANTNTLCVWTNPSPDPAFQSLAPAFSPIRFPRPHLPHSPAVCSPGGPHGLWSPASLLHGVFTSLIST